MPRKDYLLLPRMGDQEVVWTGEYIKNPGSSFTLGIGVEKGTMKPCQFRPGSNLVGWQSSLLQFDPVLPTYR